VEKVNTIPVIYAGVKAPKRATEKEMKMMKKQVAAKKPMKKYAMGGGVLTEEQKINVSKGRAPNDGGTGYGGGAVYSQSAANAAAKQGVSNMTSGGGAVYSQSAANAAAQFQQAQKLQSQGGGLRAVPAQQQAAPAPKKPAPVSRTKVAMAKGGAVKGKKPAAVALMIAMPAKGKGKTKMAMGGCATKKK